MKSSPRLFSLTNDSLPTNGLFVFLGGGRDSYQRQGRGGGGGYWAGGPRQKDDGRYVTLSILLSRYEKRFVRCFFPKGFLARL